MIPSQLEQVQSFLKDAFQRQEPIPDDPALAPLVAEHVAGNDRLSPAEQADIYRRQFFLRHVDVLRDDHPGLVHYLGDDTFEAFARAYLAAHPPRTPSLRDLGADVARFVDVTDTIPERLRPICADMARYELTIVAVFDAADVPPPDAERLREVPEDAWLTRPLVLTPHLHLHAFQHPVPDLRKAIKGEGCSKEPPAPEPIWYGVFRSDDKIAFERLPREAYDLLGLLVAGTPLAGACEALTRHLPEERAAEIEAEIGAWFQRWARWGWVLDVKRG